jgi:Na+-transporting methylmalonyl-CoA/oxaloacetate decarboxylase gamma subunit
MIENLWIAAQISLLGMSLVFGAILLLWGVLALLVHLTAERQPRAETVAVETPPAATAPAIPAATDRLARAAAAAVAVALALQHKPTLSDSPVKPNSAVSAWQAVTRATALNARRPRRS